MDSDEARNTPLAILPAVGNYIKRKPDDKMETKRKVHCNMCNQITNHRVAYEYKKQDIMETETETGMKEQHLIGTYSYQIVECLGCEAVSYLTRDELRSVIEQDKSGNFKVASKKTFEKIYPERARNFITSKKIIGVPVMIFKAYQEVVDCYNNELRILCAGGLRAIVEGICNNFGIKGKSLGDRINELSNSGLLSAKAAQALHIHKFVGNFALHRLDMPEKEELKAAIEIVEHTLIELFELPIKENNLSKMITTRVGK